MSSVYALPSGLSSANSEFSDFEDEGIKNPTGIGRKVCTKKDFTALFDLFTSNGVPFPVTFNCEGLFNEASFTREMWTAFFNAFPGDSATTYNHLFKQLEGEIAKKQAAESAEKKRKRREKMKHKNDRILARAMKKVDDLRTDLESKLAAIAEGRDETLFKSSETA